MLKKFKRYLALIPLLMVMLLNCVCYGQVIAAEDSTYYGVHYVAMSKEYPDILEAMDYRDYHNVPKWNESNFSNYLYYVYVDKTKYSDFVSGSSTSLKFTFVIYDLTNITIEENDFTYGVKSCSSSGCYYVYNSVDNTFSFDSNFSASNSIFALSKNTLYLQRFSGASSYKLYDYDITGSNMVVMIESDILDLLDIESGVLNALDVSVSFNPELNGAFSRTRYNNGQQVTLDDFNFTVSNNSKFPVQYLMAIYRDDEFFRPFNDDPLSAQAATKFNGKTYTGNPTYVYVKDEWIYLPHGTQGVITANAPSSWHYLQSGEAESVTVAFNQVKLDINVNYTCVVYAIRNDSNYATVFTNYNTFQYPACSDYCVDVSGLSCVYTSQFNILNPAEFNPNNNDNSYAFDVDDSLLFNRANGYIDENGEVVVDRVDTNSLANAGKDPNDPWSGYNPDHNAWEVYYKNQNTVSSDIDQLSNNFSSFLQFVNKVFSYFPKNYQNIIILGLTSIVVLGILKVVF